jgi:hypothetical protein
MADESLPVNNLLSTAKSREVQRAMLAEMRGERATAALHFLAAGHMELVLATDYEAAGSLDLAVRSRLGAASCFWRAGQVEPARAVFDALLKAFPARAAEIQELLTELTRDHPAVAS